MPKILYNLPSKSRPTKLINSIENIQSLAKNEDYVILVTMDVDDATVANKSFNEKLLTYEKVKPVYGFSKGKVDAINKNIWMINDWDIVLGHSDDFIFTKEGFDLDIIEAFNGFSGLVHFPDRYVNDRLCTYPMMDRKYYDFFGYIYHPEYTSVYCDSEQMIVARMLNRYKYVDKEIFVHDHYRWTGAKPDALMQLNDSSEMYKKDMVVFQKRTAINFGLKR